MKDISIIVPIYNASLYIDKCINSLLKQSKKEIEIILINDGSTDDTEEKIKKYKDKRIKYYKNKNQGIGKTRNFGIEKASGKYIIFLDSDDYLEEEACKELYKSIENSNSDIVVCDFNKIYANKKQEIIKIESFESSNLKNNPKLLNIINLGPCNKIYKTELIKNNDIKFEENIKYEDAPFVIKCLAKANKISKLNLSLTNYVIHGNSETTIRDEKIFDILKIMEQIIIYLKDEKYIKEELNKLTVRIITNYTVQQRNQINPKIADKFIEDAFALLKKYVPEYKNNEYYAGRGLLRRTIEKNKNITKLYCKLYRIIHSSPNK